MSEGAAARVRLDMSSGAAEERRGFVAYADGKFVHYCQYAVSGERMETTIFQGGADWGFGFTERTDLNQKEPSHDREDRRGATPGATRCNAGATSKIRRYTLAATEAGKNPHEVGTTWLVQRWYKRGATPP
jgi:hypothetical protein